MEDTIAHRRSPSSFLYLKLYIPQKVSFLHGKFYNYILIPFSFPRPLPYSLFALLVLTLHFFSLFLSLRSLPRLTPSLVSVAGEGEGGAAEGGNSELLEAVAEAMWHVSSLPEHVVVVKELTAVPVLVALLHHNDEKVGSLLLPRARRRSYSSPADLIHRYTMSIRPAILTCSLDAGVDERGGRARGGGRGPRLLHDPLERRRRHYAYPAPPKNVRQVTAERDACSRG